MYIYIYVHICIQVYVCVYIYISIYTHTDVVFWALNLQKQGYPKQQCVDYPRKASTGLRRACLTGQDGLAFLGPDDLRVGEEALAPALAEPVNIVRRSPPISSQVVYIVK